MLFLVLFLSETVQASETLRMKVVPHASTLPSHWWRGGGRERYAAAAGVFLGEGGSGHPGEKAGVPEMPQLARRLAGETKS